MLFAAALLGGCGSSGFQPLNRTALRASGPHTVAVAEPESPRLAVQGTTGAAPYLAALGGLGGLLVAAAIDANSATKASMTTPLTDPAVRMRAKLAVALAKRFALKIVTRDTFVTRAHQPYELVRDYPGADLVLDIRTAQWGITRVTLGNPTNADHFAGMYSGTLRLVDARSKTVIAEATCESVPVDSQDMFTFDDLLKNDGAQLRNEITSAADYCIDDYTKRVLGLY
jgi:hypothetical protein